MIGLAVSPEDAEVLILALEHFIDEYASLEEVERARRLIAVLRSAAT